MMAPGELRARSRPIARQERRAGGAQGQSMSIDHLRAARAAGDDDAFLRYARLHLGDGNEDAGRAQIDRAYVVAIKALLETPTTDYPRVRAIVAESDTGTLAQLFLYAHLELIRRCGDWIHDGEL
ncbi:MAG: hypothetical protein ABR591_12295 [Candidatus Velthaea sp.]